MPLHYDTDGALAILTIDNGPENRINTEVLEGAEDALVLLRAGVADNSVRAVLLRGAGTVFSAGADVRSLLEQGERIGILTTRFMRVLHGIESLPIPTVAAAHGLCMAGGFELALTADLLIAQDGTSFGLPESRLGIMPLAGGVQRLAERAGPSRALQSVYLTQVHDATTLHSWGVVAEVLPSENFAESAVAYARRLAAGPTRAHAATKALYRAWRSAGITGADRILSEVIEPLFGTDDARRGFTAYEDLRAGVRVAAPEFTGT